MRPPVKIPSASRYPVRAFEQPQRLTASVRIGAQNAFAGTGRSEDVLDDLLGSSATEQYEPDDPDPESEFAPDVPSVSIPDTSNADVSPELFRAFWGVVLSLNVGLFAASLGLMLVYFREQWQLGGAAFALGVGTLLYGYLKYRRYQNG